MPSTGALVGDLAGVGEVMKSPLTREAYKDALSPAMRQVGGLTEDTLKTFRLFTAPLQLAAAYQDRFRSFCERVRAVVPEDRQHDAAAEIARPVMEALESTSDDSPPMDMFETLMARAIDKQASAKLSPEFPQLIKGMSATEAILVSDLKEGPQVGFPIIDTKQNVLVGWLRSDADFVRYCDSQHYLTVVQQLSNKRLVSITETPLSDQEARAEFPGVSVSSNQVVKRSKISLSNYGLWFASACVR